VLKYGRSNGYLKDFMSDSSESVKPVLNPVLPPTIFTLLGIDELSDAEKATILQKLTMVLEDRIFARILELLTDEERDDFEVVVDKDEDGSLVDQFLTEYVPSYSDIFAEELYLLIEEMRAVSEG